jgi:ABC-2 type transport system permease protein
MRYLRMLLAFIRASFQEITAYRANFFISLFYTLLNLGSGVLAVWVLFSQVQEVRGWTFAGTLALLGTYLTVSALRGLFISPSLAALAGMDGEVWTGQFDFTLLRPVDTQFLASFRRWRPLIGIDLLLGLAVLVIAILQLGSGFSAGQVLLFALALLAGVTILYSILLIFAALIFYSPGVLFTWVFDGIFEMARYPLGLYPGWLRLILTWIVPVGVITTVPAQALTGALEPLALVGMLALALGLLAVSSLLFRIGLRKYKSASS